MHFSKDEFKDKESVIGEKSMFDFDEVVDRKGTNCAKWDTIEAKNKPKDVLPMWVADYGF